jgi:hypothetical protein
MLWNYGIHRSVLLSAYMQYVLVIYSLTLVVFHYVALKLCTIFVELGGIVGLKLWFSADLSR